MALLYRGVIVSAWANVEATLIELAVRTSRCPAYAGIRDTYPWKLKGRISYLRDVLARPGPIESYRGLGETVLNRFDRAADLRNLMAHARMETMSGSGCVFTMFVPKTSVELSVLTLRFSLGDMKAMARRAARFSRVVRRLAWRIDKLGLLPHLDGGN